MTSPIVVQIDTELKQKAMQMAKKEGLTMKALLSFLLKGYTEHEIILTSQRRPAGISHFEFEELLDDELEVLHSSKKIQEYNNRLQKL